MTIEHTPAFARSDVRPAPGGTSSPTTRPFVRQGFLLTAGALAWAAVTAAVGSTDPEGATEEAIFSAGSGLFQLGLLGLLFVLFRTQALGAGRLARFFIRLEAVLLTLAIASTFVDGIGVSDLDQTGWLILDMFWPISMLGMFMIGVRVAIAGRWSGVSRFWPLVAESWALVVIPTMGIAGEGAATVVSCIHLTVGYAVLGQIVARKQG
jgi:hypothetical protein